MSELSSAFPVSVGLYFWSFMLAGKKGPYASWIVGWLNLLGQVTCQTFATAYTVIAVQDIIGANAVGPCNCMHLHMHESTAFLTDVLQ